MVTYGKYKEEQSKNGNLQTMCKKCNERKGNKKP